MKRFFCAILLTASLTACSQSAVLPDDPPSVPETTAAMSEVDMAAMIDDYLTKLSSPAWDDADERALIAVNPQVYESLLALGDAAVPYLQKVGSMHQQHMENIDFARCMLACYAAHELDPSLYDREYPSPDGRYMLTLAADTFRGMADPFTGILREARLTDAHTGEVLASSRHSSELAEAVWSPDGRFAAICDRLEQDDLPGMVKVFDTKTGRVTPMAYSEAVDAAKAAAGTDAPHRFFDTIGIEWTAEGMLRVEFSLTLEHDAGILGRYTCDPADGRLVHVHAESAAHAIVSENLNRMLSDGMPSDTDVDAIRAFVRLHPEAFDRIAALGSEGTAVLASIAAEASDHPVGSDAQNRCFFAQTLAYLLDPSLYARTSVSPDGGYTLTIKPISFFSQWNSEWGITYGGQILTDADGEVMAEGDAILFFPSEPIWSPDGRIALVEHSIGNDRYGNQITVIDEYTRRVYALPAPDPASLKPAAGNIYSMHFKFVEWGGMNDVLVEAQYAYGSPSDMLILPVQYIVRLHEGGIDGLWMEAGE